MVTYAATATVIPYLERKDPADELEYTVDWSDYLETSETISTVTWTVPTGLTEGTKTVGSKTATVWLSGGTAGTTYTVGCKVTTNTTRVCERSFRVLVAER